MSNKNFEQSFDNLKQTIPLLLKHKLPAVPNNYALWYTYVTNEFPNLNSAVDDAVANSESLSEAKTEDLYKQCLAEQENIDVWELRQSLEAMLIEVGQSMKDTHSDTQVFKSVMDTTLDDLSRVEKEGWSIDEVIALVRNMVHETQAIRQSTLSFNTSLANAEKEIERLKLRLHESEQEALYDALTGLCNRRYFDSEFETKMKMDKLALILLDIDHFKQINDNYGHLMGDLVIKAVAQKLQSCCRDRGQVFRYGGEEFVVLVPNANASTARQMAERMRRTIEKLTVKDRRTEETLNGITISAGIAERHIKESGEKFLARADKALYQAKNLGRNRVMPLE